ncbi:MULTISPECIES: hypothetical protein [unclassified Nocardia]|uniref:hypothetical protein n=1 Tax=unclassified Nocardia TaxID=2637762 RepID=UPI0024A9A999|nr:MULTISPECIES: hypothetical protein [unclassified Nocardia]
MATATLHIADLGGYAGPARCYRLDPVPVINGAPAPFVTIWVQRGYAHQMPEVNVVPATSSGACATRSVMAAPGSFTLHFEPVTDEQIDGAHWLALQALGGYTVSGQRPTEPEAL